MSNARDVKLKITERFTNKADKENIKRAVITDALGNMSGAGSIWYDQDARRVWHMVHGATQPAPIRCTRLPNPYIGLKVLIGKTEGVFEYEVLSDDPYDRPGNATGSNWTAALSTVDLSPGGRALLWLQTKAVVPLAVWPGTGLSVNINAGDYQYGNVWTKYFGTTNYDLSASQPAGPNEHLYVGLYLDSTGNLQTVDGATVDTGATPPNPAFPADVFRLAMVRLNDSQTSFSYHSDIYDWRPIWADPQGGGMGDVVGPAAAVDGNVALFDGITGKLIKDSGSSIADIIAAAGGWPFDKVITVSSTNTKADYSSLDDALTALPGPGYTILLDAETFTETVVITEDCTIIGLNRWKTIITGAENDEATIDTRANVNFANLTVSNTGNGGGGVPGFSTRQCAVLINGDGNNNGNVNFLDCIISVDTDNANGSMALGVSGADTSNKHRLINTDVITVNSNAASTNDHAVFAGATTEIDKGKITGQDYDICIDVGDVVLKTPTLQNNLIGYTGGGWTLTGSWMDANGLIYPQDVVIDVTKTVGADKDYTTIQGALDYFANKICVGCYINVDAGTYDEFLTLSVLSLTNNYRGITIQGDSRVLAGAAWVDGAPILNGQTNGGTGACALSNSGNNIVVAGATTNPDFGAGGVMSGDKVMIFNNSWAWAEYTVSSVSANTITLTTAAPAVGSTGTSIILLPNRRLIPSSGGTPMQFFSSGSMIGFYIKAYSTSYVCISGSQLINILFSNTCLDNAFYALNTFGGTNVFTGGRPNSIIRSTAGIVSRNGSFVRADRSVAVGCTVGFNASANSHLHADYAVAAKCTQGISAISGGNLRAESASAVACTTGYYAIRQSFIDALTTNANNSGNTTNYSPATSDTVGNVNSIITWS